MRETERSDDQTISTDDARQGVTGQNVRVVLMVSLLLAATSGAILVGYFWMRSPWAGS